MRTEELRRELRDLASDVEPFAADPARVRQRVRRTRLALTAAMVVALAIPVGVFVLRDDGGQDIRVAGAKSLPIGELRSRDALILVGAGGDVADVRSRLEASIIIEAFTELPAGAATALEPLGLRRSEPHCDVGGFVVDLRDGTSAEDLDATAVGGIVSAWDDVLAGPDDGRWAEGDIEVFMTVDATPEQIDAVAEGLAQDARVGSVDHLTKQDAYEEFTRIFADQPELLASTRPEALPESFRLIIADDADVDAIAAAFASMPGVDEVLSAHESAGGDRDGYVERVLEAALLDGAPIPDVPLSQC
jgi:hypothetical protein